MLDPWGGGLDRAVFVTGHAAGGPGEENARLYAVSAVELAAGGDPREHASMIRFSGSTEREFHRSGMSREKLAAAPGRAKAESSLREFLGDAPFAFVLVDHGPVDELAGMAGRRVIDLAFAAEFFFPALPLSTPKALWELVHGRRRERSTFPPAELSALAVDVARTIVERCLDDSRAPAAPVLRHFLAASRTLFGDAFLGLVDRYRDFFGGLFTPRGRPDDADWRSHLEVVAERPRRPDEEPIEEVRPVRRGDLKDRFKALAGVSPGFTLRKEQLRYADLIAGAFSGGHHLVIEAGTGTGKTFGYLVPLLEFLQRNPSLRAVVSTYTKNLQDQVHGNELARLRAAFPLYRDIPVSLLKGKSSYVCAEKLADALEEGMGGPRLLAWLYLLEVLIGYRTVEVGSAGERVRAALDADRFLTRLSNDVSARTGCRSDHDRCPAQMVLGEAARARLLVTNHHKLALLEREPVLKGLFNRVVIDEANHFETAARSAQARSVSSRDLADQLEWLVARVPALGRAGLERIARAVESIGRAAETAQRELDLLGGSLRAQAGESGEEGWIEPSHPAFRDGALAAQAEPLGKLLAALAEDLSRLAAEEGTAAERTRRRLGLASEVLGTAGEDLSAMAASAGDAGFFIVARAWQRHWILTQSRIDMAPHLAATLLRERRSIVFTSATLAAGGSLRIFCRTLGIDQAEADEGGGADEHPWCRTAIIPSPFRDVDRRIIVPADAPSGDFRGREEWLAYVHGIIPRLVAANRGGVLVLFASHRDLRRTEAAVADGLTAAGFPVLSQRPGVPTSELSEEFRAVRESVLFGTETFWHGVDFRGETLTMVIVTRIPFPHPGEPLQMGRRRALSDSEYWERYRYDTAIRLKQGIGRLIRGEEDRGTVVILDSRYPSFQRVQRLGLPVDGDDPFARRPGI